MMPSFFKQHRFLLLEILVIVFILGIALFPWPSSSNYGHFSGFDSSNLYVQPNPNFNVQVNSSVIKVMGGGSSSETIHLALSDLPYTTTFSIILRGSSSESSPVIGQYFLPAN